MDNVFELIAANYTAVQNLCEADFTPTTEELHEKLVKHTGKDDLTIESVFIFMEETGFKHLDIGELYLVWLMRSDHPVFLEREFEVS